MNKLVLDAVGGDHGPRAAIDGALLAVERGHISTEQLILTGPEATVAEAMEGRGLARDHFRIVDAPDLLLDSDTPVEAMRRKPRNSIAVGIGLVKEDQAQAFISAGSTGTVVACATVGLRCLPGIRRPGIAVLLHGAKGPFMVIDVGANPQPKAIDLLHYGLMGAAYFHDTMKVARPRVGLMNIGSEDAKGNPLVKEARELLAKAPIEFIGNVEGVDVFQGGCDVVVADGFTGNVLLKVSEGLAEFMLQTFGAEMAAAGIEGDQVRRVVGTIAKKVDYSEFGGALLLGVEGSVTICHGRSEAPAICNAIRFAVRAMGANVNHHIVEAAAKAADASA